MSNITNGSVCPNDLNGLCDFIFMFKSPENGVVYLRNGKVSDIWFSIVGIIVSIIGSVSIIGNLGIFFILCGTFKSKRSRFLNLNLLSLTISGLGMCSSVLPFVVHSSVNRGWKLGVHGCKVDGFLGGFFAFLQLNTLCEIAIQRYLGVKSLNANAKRRAGLYRLALVWAISALIAALPLFGFGRFMLEGIGVSCTFNYIEKDTVNLLFVVSINVVEFFVPCTIIICSYVGTMKVCETSRCDLEQISMVERHRIIFKRRERRLAKICVISVACFVVSWAPYSTMSLLMVFTNVHVPHLFASIAACIAKMSTAVNGTIYVVNHQDFQKSLRRYIPCFSGVIQDSNNFTSIERRPSSRCRGNTAVTFLQR